METFTFQIPTKINFGIDTVSGIGEAAVELGGTRPILITDSVLLSHGLAQPLLASLAESGLGQPVIFSEVPPDSDLEAVRQATKVARSAGVDLVVALGGGSVLDTAKAVNIGLTFDGDVLDFEGLNNLPSRLRPMIAVPTTAGTGSEVSAVAMLKNTATGQKVLFGSRYLCADLAILDPRLLVSLPPRLTAATGLDAITHCLEAYAGLGSNALCDSLCLEAVAMMFHNLRRATDCGEDLDARGATLLASSMAGMAFTNAGVGVVHALSHAVGGCYGTHHGLTNAVFLPHGMAFNMPVAYRRYATCWRHLKAYSSQNGHSPAASPDFDDDMAAAAALLEAVKEIINDCRIPSTLRDLGVPELSETQFLDLAETAMTDPAIMFNPREATLQDLIDILKRAY